jgi:hypothetical protein
MLENETKNGLVAFHDEIKRIKKSDKTLFAVDNPENLGVEAMNFFNELKSLFSQTDLELISNSCLDIAERAKNYAKEQNSKDNTEFVAWMRNKLAAIKTNAYLLKEGTINQDEFNEEINLIKESFYK